MELMGGHFGGCFGDSGMVVVVGECYRGIIWYAV